MANVSSSNGLEKRPKLRFPGFDEPWMEKKLDSLLSPRVEKQIPSEEAPLMAFTAEGGVEPKGERYDRSYLVKSEDKLYKRTEYNDFIYSSNNLDVGSIGLNKYGTAVISDVYEIFSVLPDNLPTFISELIQRPHNIAEILKYRQGCLYGQYRIYAEDFLSVSVLVPEKAEQERISSFLDALDNKINHQARLIKSLKKYKRGLLRKIFAKLSDRCEKRNLKELSVLFADGDWIESKDQASDGIRLIQTGNVGFGVYLDKPQNAKYISDDTFHRLNCLEIYDGDILISRLPEPAGRACLLPKSAERRITAVDCTVIRTDAPVIDRNYLLQFLCSEQYLKTVNSFLAGGTRQRISRKNLEGIEVPYPSIDKQEYYGSFLCKVDARVFNEEQRLSYFTRLRCFMLQQLFI